MGSMVRIIALLSLLLVLLFPVIYGWGIEGHTTVCRIAQARLSSTAADAVQQMQCSNCFQSTRKMTWEVFAYGLIMSSLSIIGHPRFTTSTHLTIFALISTIGTAKMILVNKGAGAINNYTSQLQTYSSGSSTSDYNLTEALLFLSHFFGDIHQPLHVGFSSDRGGNTIDVHLYTRKQNLHHVWDSNIIETAEERFNDNNLDELVDAIKQNITTEWADEVKAWETCSLNKTACPDEYAVEGIKAACDYAYKGVDEGSVLQDPYFLSRIPVVNRRLAQGGVRLAATLNRIFG